MINSDKNISKDYDLNPNAELKLKVSLLIGYDDGIL